MLLAVGAAVAEAGLKPVNGDGHVDLLCHFLVKLTALTAGSTTATMRGQLSSGARFAASDAVGSGDQKHDGSFACFLGYVTGLLR